MSESLKTLVGNRSPALVESQMARVIPVKNPVPAMRMVCVGEPASMLLVEIASIVGVGNSARKFQTSGVPSTRGAGFSTVSGNSVASVPGTNGKRSASIVASIVCESMNLEGTSAPLSKTRASGRKFVPTNVSTFSVPTITVPMDADWLPG